MSYDCREFCEALSRALEGLAVPPALTALSWHEHLLGCQSCRDLLEKEEALEVLLATLPDPKLPSELTKRLVALLRQRGGQSEADALVSAEHALASAQPIHNQLDSLLDLAGAGVPEGLSARVRAAVRAEQALDALLDFDREPAIPAGLAGRVLAGLQSAADAQLERLLDLDPVIVPAGLSQRVLAELAGDRKRVVPRLRLLRSMPVYAAAAGLVLTALGIGLWQTNFGSTQRDDNAQPTREQLASNAATNLKEPDPSLLAVLDLLENDSLWEESAEGVRVASQSDDLTIMIADTLDTGDEILLAFLEE